MSLEQRDRFIRHVFSIMAPYLDLLSSGFSFGFDHLWRRQAVSRSGIGPGANVLDVCTGTGKLAVPLSRAVGPCGRVIGADFCAEMLTIARKKSGNVRSNLSYVLADAKRLPFDDSTFDAVTVAFGMRNIPDTSLALKEISRVLKPGGAFVCLELTRPTVAWLRTLHSWYVSQVMPVIGKLIVKTSVPYLYLPRSIKAFYSPEEFRMVIVDAGFSRVSVDSLTMGIATLFRAFNHA